MWSIPAGERLKNVELWGSEVVVFLVIEQSNLWISHHFECLDYVEQLVVKYVCLLLCYALVA